MPEARAEQVVAALEREDIGAVLHQEVSWLPAKYRAAVVLCYFEGRTHDEAAAALQWPVGTVRSYLARGRDLLRGRLARRGLAPAGLIAASLLEPVARAEVPAPLLAATVAAAIKGTPAAAGVAVLADIVSRYIFVARITIVGAVLSLVVMATGLGLVLRGNFASPPQHSLDPAPAASAQSRPLDRRVDPLPMHARTRLGTSRFHAGSSINRAIHTHDGKAIVAVDSNHVVRVWDAASGRVVSDIGDFKLNFREIAVSPDGKTLATVEQPARLRLWDIATGREHRHWREARDEEYQHVRFSPDGRTIAVGVTRYDENTKERENCIYLWNTIAPTERRERIPGDWLNLWDFEFSPDGKILATATRDTEVTRGNVLIGPEKSSTRIWDITGLEQMRFPVEGYDVFSLAFSPDGKLLACGISDGTVRFHDVGTGREFEPGWCAIRRFRPVHRETGADPFMASRGQWDVWHSRPMARSSQAVSNIKEISRLPRFSCGTSPAQETLPDPSTSTKCRVVVICSRWQNDRFVRPRAGDPALGCENGQREVPANGTPDGSGLASHVAVRWNHLHRRRRWFRPAVGRRFGTRVGSRSRSSRPPSLRWPLHPTVRLWSSEGEAKASERSPFIFGAWRSAGRSVGWLASRNANRSNTLPLPRMARRSLPSGGSGMLSRAACW